MFFTQTEFLDHQQFTVCPPVFTQKDSNSCRLMINFLYPSMIGHITNWNIYSSNRYNYYMAIFSVTFLMLSYQLTNLFGPVGFILANCTNMIFRISYSTFYIFKQYRPVKINPLNGIRPGKVFSIVLVIMGAVCKVSEVKMYTDRLGRSITIKHVFFRHEFSKHP